MSEPLATYLHDHLAGSRMAIDLMKAMRDQNRDQPLGPVLAGVLAEVEQDRDTLGLLTERIPRGRPNSLKEAAAWLSEKTMRLKLHRIRNKGLGNLEALEFLSLGILGKLALWKALSAVASGDSRLSGFDFVQLAARAQGQHTIVESERLKCAASVLARRS